MSGKDREDEFSSLVSATTPDWSREQPRCFWDPGRKLLSALRAYQRHAARQGAFHALMQKWAVLRHRFWSVVTGADIPLDCQIGGGLLIPHPNGIVIHPAAEIGPNCLIFQQVTIGTVEGRRPPRIGGHADVGAGAKVLGGITIGNHVRIGANAVVLESIDDHSVAVGIPAKPIRKQTVKRN